MLYPIVSLLLGLPFLLVTISFKSERNTKDSDLSILSFNAKYFRKLKTYDEFSVPMIRWLADDTSDIKCLQEYSTNSMYPEIDVTKQVKAHGYHSFVYRANIKDADHNPGMAIFTKYNILDSGLILNNQYSINEIMYVDIKKKSDTIRIYNVHLESMGLDIHGYKYFNRYEAKLKRLGSRLKWGAEQRSTQIYKLIEHTAQSPYPYIICGDFNDTPYSYNYFKLKRYFNNTFEEAGNGFGFTFNSLLFFLRIDHQFYSEQIEPLDFHVDRSMKISDHFPTRGIYRIKN